MDRPTRIDDKKYKRILDLSEQIKIKRPAEGAVIHKLVLHVEELYEYIDFLEENGNDDTLDDNALARLGVPQSQIAETHTTPNTNRNPVRTGRRSRSNRNRVSNSSWQAPRTDLSYLDDIDSDIGWEL